MVALSVENTEVQAVVGLFLGILLIIEEENLAVLAWVEDIVEIGPLNVIDLSFHRIWDRERMDASEYTVVFQIPEANDCDLCLFLVDLIGDKLTFGVLDALDADDGVDLLRKSCSRVELITFGYFGRNFFFLFFRLFFLFRAVFLVSVLTIVVAVL